MIQENNEIIAGVIENGSTQEEYLNAIDELVFSLSDKLVGVPFAVAFPALVVLLKAKKTAMSRCVDGFVGSDGERDLMDIAEDVASYITFEPLIKSKNAMRDYLVGGADAVTETPATEVPQTPWSKLFGVEVQ